MKRLEKVVLSENSIQPTPQDLYNPIEIECFISPSFKNEMVEI